MSETDVSLTFCSGWAYENYIQVIEHLAAQGIVGGATYDALILRAAANARVDLVVTLNVKDFERIYPELADKIVAP